MIWRSKLRTSLHDSKEGMPLLTALIISAEKSALSMATLPIEIRPVPIQYLRGILGRGEGREMERHESAASLHLYFQDAHALGPYYAAIDEHEKNLLAVAATNAEGLAFALDRAMNNTSVVALFNYGGKNLLFPGDAQYGSWESWIENADMAPLLADVN